MQKIFRFQDFEIWKKAASLSGRLFDIADRLEKEHKYRFAEQLRAAALSISNNIAEGSGSTSSIDFKHYLNMARRSVSEVANILMILSENAYVKEADVVPLLLELQEESKMITGFMASLKSRTLSRFDFP
jgi:four helix bundle protein